MTKPTLEEVNAELASLRWGVESRHKTTYEFKVWVGAGFHRVRAANIIEAVGAVLSKGLRAEEVFKVEMVTTPGPSREPT